MSESRDEIRERLEAQTQLDPSPVGETVPRSQSPRGREQGTGPISLGTLDEPPPREWAVGGLVPEGCITILVGHSGVGKSFLAMLLALCVCIGRSFFGRSTLSGPVLWVDRELDRDETLRRAYWVARGLGLDRPPVNLHYLKPLRPVGSPETQRLVLDAVRETGAALVVLDSLSVGSQGDAKDQRDVVGLMKMIEEWRTVLAIDHFTKAGAAGNQSSATIFGSAFKRAIARSTIKLTQADGGALTLRPDKSNFGAEGSPIHFKTDHGEPDGKAVVTFAEVGEDDESMVGAEAHAPAHEQTYLALVRLHAASGAPVHLNALAAEREVTAKTIRNHLTRLKRDGRVRPGAPDNAYLPVPIPKGDSQQGTVGNDEETYSRPPTPTEAHTAPESPSLFPAPKEQGTRNGEKPQETEGIESENSDPIMKGDLVDVEAPDLRGRGEVVQVFGARTGVLIDEAVQYAAPEYVRRALP